MDSALTDKHRKKLQSRKWRLNNLYWIINQKGERVKFKLNKAQKMLLNNLHRQNIILKARQLGFTTFICIFALDLILFNSNVRAGILAHEKTAATAIFQDKIKYPYSQLPPELKEKLPALKDDAGELRLVNNSSVRVATSLRSGTYQLVHVSEHGKICAKYPVKAEELKTGTLEALHEGSFLFIESTAEGDFGDFHDWCEDAEKLKNSGIEPGAMELKFHFFSWFEKDDNRTDPEAINVEQKYVDEVNLYCDKLEDQLGVKLDFEQRAWYAVKKHGSKGLKDKMTQEHPSTPSEAFYKPVEGAYYARLLGEARDEGRIKRVTCDGQFPVYTFWDLGVADSTTIWFVQFIETDIRVIDYYEDSGKALHHYIRLVKNKPYVYGDHFAPHDIRVRSYSTGVSRWQTAKQLGITFKIVEAESVADGIDAVRGILPLCWFDSENCKTGRKSLKAYRKEWNERLGKFNDKPLHDWASHAADSFRYMAVVYRYGRISGRFHNPQLAAAEQRKTNFDPLTYGL